MDGTWIRLEAIHYTGEWTTVHNFRVQEDHTYFVGDPTWGFAVWVHNTHIGAMASHAPVSPKIALDSAGTWLGQGYIELAPGVFRSADGLKQFRMTTADLIPTHGGVPHVHFEALNKAGKVIENLHLPIQP